MKNHLYAMFNNIKKGQSSRRNFIFTKRKKICEAFLRLIWNEGFILGYSIYLDNLKIFLKYKAGEPVIHSINIISKPSRRVYYSTKQLWKIDSTKSFIVLSTNKGLKSLETCKKLKIGGEPYIVIK